MAPLSSGRLGGGFAAKGWLDYVQYEYDDGVATEAASIGLEGAVGYQASGRKGWGSAYLGLRFSDTSLSPDDPGSEARGSHVRVKAQAEGERRLAEDWTVNAGGYFGIEFSKLFK